MYLTHHLFSGEELEYWVEADDDLKSDCDGDLEPTQDNLEL